MWPASIIPPTGYWFDEAGIRVESGSMAGLIAALIQYRKDSGSPPGDPEFEVHFQLCKRHPSLGTVLTDRKLAKSVTKSIKDFIMQRRANVSPEEAKRRAAICSACPMREEWKSTCESCGGKSTDLIARAFKGREKSQQGYACKIAGDELCLACVFVPNTKLKIAPANCWRKA